MWFKIVSNNINLMQLIDEIILQLLKLRALKSLHENI